MQDQAERLWLRVAFEEGRMMVILPMIGFLCSAASCILNFYMGDTLRCVIMFLCAAENMYFLFDAMNNGGRQA